MAVCCLFVNNKQVFADNTDVLDQAGVLDAKTQREIKEINDDELSKVMGHPQIVVVTRKSLEGTGCNNVDDYGQQLFDKYHFGRSGYDNGVLLLIILHPHHFHMQTGYGVESVLPDIYVNDLMTPHVQDLFKEGDYSTGTLIMVRKTSRRIIDKQDDLRSKSAVKAYYDGNRDAEQSYFAGLKGILSALLVFIVVAGIPAIIFGIFYKIRQDKLVNEFDKQAPKYLDQVEETKRQNMQYLNNHDKAQVMKEVAGGAIFATALASILLMAGKRHEQELEEASRIDNYRDDDDDDNSGGFFGGGSGGFDDDDDFGGGDFGGGDFGGFGGDSGGGGGDSTW